MRILKANDSQLVGEFIQFSLGRQRIGEDRLIGRIAGDLDLLVPMANGGDTAWNGLGKPFPKDRQVLAFLPDRLDNR
ncbi:MAG: hypothetical protein E6Q98_05785 [Rhodospirillaceae bacterium]|nr:MAG: hypothetical protein E6Q98_05785 [Rhodospirillaceae bacterium]